jgi:GT2 family glycosyltransferase
MTTVRIFVAAAGNEFMLDIAAAFRDGFVEAGCHCSVEADGRPSPESANDLQFVLAPHEYFLLSPAHTLEEHERAALLKSCHLINVEQPGSSWFELAAGYARQAGGVFDINRDGVDEFRCRGIAAAYAPLGLVPALPGPRPLPMAERPIDVLLMGHASPKREEFIARHGAFFSNPRCRVVLADVARPRRVGTPGYYSGDDRTRLLASSRILLNVHSAERSYFEGHRALLALANGCLLVTETSRHTDPLEAGRHFVMAPLDELVSVCETYLSDPAQLEYIAGAGRRFAAESMTMAATCRAMLDVVQRNISMGSSVGTQPKSAFDLAAARTAVMSRLQESLERRRNGAPDWRLITNEAYERSEQPAVSVLVTLHNYEDHIAECLASVTRSEAPPGGVELVVVDDASTDGSGSVAERLVHEMGLPAVVVRKNLNTGLADARNVAIELARGDAVFVLDADNWIYPTCLKRLHAELVDGGLAATYGMLQRFSGDTGQPLGLLSKYDWSVADLVRGPYIDAMALFDRRAVLDAGGYATELIAHGWFGWEDYALWLAFAQRGYQCRLVPFVAGAYRVHHASMIHRTNTSTDQIALYLREKFSDLVAEYPDLERYFGFPAPVAARISRPAAVGLDHTIETDGERISDLERQIGELRDSMSWRVTAPLRFVYRVLTGRRH